MRRFRNLRKVRISLALAAALTTACTAGPESATAAVPGEATLEIEPTVMTAEATATTTPRPFQVYSSQDAVNAIIAAGLEAEEPAPLDVDGHSPLPPTFVEALRFQMPSLGDRTGRLFSFASAADLQAVKGYYEGFAGSQASLVFVKENLLLQVSAAIPAGVAGAKLWIPSNSPAKVSKPESAG